MSQSYILILHPLQCLDRCKKAVLKPRIMNCHCFGYLSHLFRAASMLLCSVSESLLIGRICWIKGPASLAPYSPVRSPQKYHKQSMKKTVLPSKWYSRGRLSLNVVVPFWEHKNLRSSGSDQRSMQLSILFPRAANQMPPAGHEWNSVPLLFQLAMVDCPWTWGLHLAYKRS